MDERTIDSIVQLVIKGIENVGHDMFEVPVKISARHVHLSEEHVEMLFGKGYSLTKKKELMGGQYACEECVTIVGIKLRAVENVRVLGPTRKSTQIEVSQTDCVRLGVAAPVKDSGNLSGSSPVTVVGPKGAVYVNEGLIIAKRHIHMPPKDAANAKVKDGDIVSVKFANERGAVLDNVLIRVDESFTLEMHVDTDEANALKIGSEAYGVIV